MNRINIADSPLVAGLRAVKNAIANLMGIKRLEYGANFVEDAGSAEPLTGNRQYSMGDLWRDPLDNQPRAEGEPSDADITCALPEAVPSPK